MNRNNFKWHLAIAVLIIGVAALLGQVRKWSARLGSVAGSKISVPAPPSPVAARTAADGEPEVLVKFKPNVGLAQIKSIVRAKNDRVEDVVEKDSTDGTFARVATGI